MLTNVVLPAPFGPISAWRAPASRRKSMLSATVSAPKLLQSFFVSSETIEDAEVPPRGKKTHEDEERADAEVPVPGVLLGGGVLPHDVAPRADEPAIEA